MTALAETSTWETEIYQLEETDVVQGGAPGIDNVQPRQLANRTQYLKTLVEALSTGKLDLSAKATQALAEAGINDTTWMTPLRVAQAIAALATVVMASDTVAGKVELATIAETITGIDTARATHAAGVKAAIAAAITGLVNSSPTTLDTLNELANALGNDPNFASSIATQIGGKQNLDATLTALSGLTVAANKLIYATGADAFATTDLSAFMRTLLDDADAATARATLGLSGRPGHTYAANDWIPLGDGIILQWGTTASIASSASSGTITFPIAFPSNAAYVNIIGVGAVTSGANTNLSLVTKTAANFSFLNSYLSSELFNWIAIGY